MINEVLKNAKVHIAVCGCPGSGIHTLLNALCRRITVPEGYLRKPPSSYVIKRQNSDYYSQVIMSSQLSIFEYLKRDCYNRRIDYVTIKSPCNFVSKNAVLSGHYISDRLPLLTEPNHKVDVLIYIVGTDMLTTNDIAFLQCCILGYTPKEQDIKKLNYDVEKPIITPNQLIILGNDKNGIFRAGLVESVKRIFKSDDCKLSDAQITQFCNKNIWIANVLYGRLIDAGIYDYVEYAPEGMDDGYLSGCRSLNDRQKRYLDLIEHEDEETMKEIDCWKLFRNHIYSLVGLAVKS